MRKNNENTKSNTYCNTFGYEINKALYTKGLTQKWLAKETGLNPVSITHYIQNKTKPRPAALMKICTALDIDPVYLFDLMLK